MPPGRVPFAAWPTEYPAWIALAVGLAVVVLVPLVGTRRLRLGSSRWTLALALLAGGLSVLYVHVYLRGGPRIVDASSYWLEARAIAKGLLTWPLDEPTASFRGRFLLHRLGADGGVGLGVIFPPGYAALLALGFLAGAPMAVGPCIAVGLVVVTAALARQLSRRNDVATVAAAMSALCSALRYHTADTMSHGLAALVLTSSLVLGFAARDARAGRRRAALMIASGLAFGWLLATRPVSGLALAIAAAPFAFLAATREPSARKDLGWLAVGAVAPVVLLVGHQAATTGSAFGSPQLAYYALADGPPNCFRYGFGRGIGCLVEHGTYVRDLLPDGYGFVAVVRTTGRRLVLHLEDVLNLPMAIVLVPLGAWAGRRSKRTGVLTAVVVVQVLAYAPFYFDGNYPGGGARMLADVIPAEHVLAAIAVGSWVTRIRAESREAWGVAAAAGSMLLGFAFFNAPKHAALRDRDGGRPFYEPAIVEAALGADPRGLLFVDSDHGFNLAHDPSVADPARGLLVARARHDDRDRLLWERLGRPEAWEYRWLPWVADAPPPRVERWIPTELTAGRWRFEAEAEWPPLAQRGGYAAPTWLAPDSCVSSGLALALIRTGEEEVCATVQVPVPGPGTWRVVPWLVLDGRTEVRAQMDHLPSGGESRRWHPGVIDPAEWRGAIRSELDGRWCVPLESREMDAEAGRTTLTLCTSASWAALDTVDVRAGEH